MRSSAEKAELIMELDKAEGKSKAIKAAREAEKEAARASSVHSPRKGSKRQTWHPKLVVQEDGEDTGELAGQRFD